MEGYFLFNPTNTWNNFPMEYKGQIVPANKRIVLDLVKGNARAEKIAGNDNLKKAIKVYNKKAGQYPNS